MIDYILCLLGIFIYFVNRYANRTDKTKLSIKYWFQDNSPELLSTLALNAALMILIHMSTANVDINPVFQSLPFVLQVAGKPTLSFFLGLGLTSWFYRMFRSKTESK